MPQKSIDRAFVGHVAGEIMAAQLAKMTNPVTADDVHLNTLADMAVRAAIAVDAAIPRAEKRLTDEEKAAAQAEAAPDADQKVEADEQAKSASDDRRNSAPARR